MEMQYEDRTYIPDDREEFELNALAQDNEQDDDGEMTTGDGTENDPE